MSKPTKTATSFIVAGCFHVPYHDYDACEMFKQAIVGEQPDYVIINGDLLEAGAASVHPNEDKHTLQEEYAEASFLLSEIRKAATYKGKANAKLIYLLGNHDANILAENRIPKKLRGLCDFKTHMGDELQHWTTPFGYVADRESVFRLGQVGVHHGHMTGVHAGRHQAMLYAVPFGLDITSHTHQGLDVYQVPYTQSIPTDKYAANTGCMRNLKPEFVRQKNTHNWTHSYVIGDCDASLKSLRLRPYWSAETRFIKVSDDYLRPKFEGKYGRFASVQ